MRQKNADGKSFSTTRADSYKAVYYVEPVNTAHPAYRFSRNVTVKEQDAGAAPKASLHAEQKATADSTAGEAAASETKESAEDEDTETDSTAAGSTAAETASPGTASTASGSSEKPRQEKAEAHDKTDTAFSEATSSEAASLKATSLEATSSEDSSSKATSSEAAPSKEAVGISATAAAQQEAAEVLEDEYGEEEWTVSGIIRWATEQEEISLAEMGVGETVTMSLSKKKCLKAAFHRHNDRRDHEGQRYHYYDYGLGAFWAPSFYIKYGNISATPHCIEPSKSAGFGHLHDHQDEGRKSWRRSLMQQSLRRRRFFCRKIS